MDEINFQIGVVGHDWTAENVCGRVAIRTDIDRQTVLPFGTPGQVRDEVQRTFETYGTERGGIIACIEIGPDIPLANILGDVRGLPGLWESGGSG